MSETDSLEYIVLYREIKNLESDLRNFIRCKLERQWGAGWLEQIKNILPDVYNGWTEKAKKDRSSQNKELIEFIDFSDYSKIISKFDKIFTNNAEDKNKILAHLGDIKEIRDRVMHSRSGITKDDISFIRVSIRKLKHLLNIDECKKDVMQNLAESEKAHALAQLEQAAINPIESLRALIEQLGFLPYLEKLQTLLLKAYAAYGIKRSLPVIKEYKKYEDVLVEEYLEPKEAIELLKELGFAKEGESFGKLNGRRYYTIILSEDGINLAKQISVYLVEKNKEEIDEVMKEYGSVAAFLAAAQHVLKNFSLFTDHVNPVPTEFSAFIESVLESNIIQTHLNNFISKFGKLDLAFSITIFNYRMEADTKKAMLPELALYVWQKSYEKAKSILYDKFLGRMAAIKILSELPKNQKSIEELLDTYVKDFNKDRVLDHVKNIAKELYEAGAISQFSEKQPYFKVIREHRFIYTINQKERDLINGILDYF